MNHTPTTFRPPWWRCFVSSIIELIPLLLSWLIGAWLSDIISNRSVSFLDGLFFPFAMIVLFQLLTTSRRQDELTITISDGMIVRLATGGEWGWPRIQFPLHKVDCERIDRKPTVRQRLFRQRYSYLWSTDGHKIPIDYWAFTPAQVTALLRLIGCGEDQSGSSITNEH
jgi:hypothetical protein